MDVIVCPNIADLFPNEVASMRRFCEVLGVLNRTEALLYCARLSNICSRMDQLDLVQGRRAAVAFLNLSRATRDSINGFAAERGGAKTVAVVHRAQLLELTRWLVVYAADDPPAPHFFEDEECRELFFRALLLAGEVWTTRVFKTIGDAAAPDRPNADAHRLALLRRSHVENEVALPLAVAVGRGWELVAGELTSIRPEFEGWVRDHTGMGLLDLFSLVWAFSSAYLEGAQTMPGGNPNSTGLFARKQVLEATKQPSACEAFLDTFATSVEQLTSGLWPDGRPGEDPFVEPPPFSSTFLRSNPILATADGRLAILDPLFFRELAGFGAVFQVPGGKRKAAIDAFGLALERYVQKILTRIAPASELIEGGAKHNVQKRSGGKTHFEIDSLIVRRQGAFLFETKSAWLREDVLALGEEGSFLANFEAAFGSPTKGTGQLAHAISWLTSHDESLWPSSLEGVDTFYPVLVTQDRRMDPSFGAHLQQRFRRQLGLPDGRWHPYPSLNGYAIAPLVFLNIDEVEALEEASRKCALSDIIADFASVARHGQSGLLDFLHKAKERWQVESNVNMHVYQVGDAFLERACIHLFGAAPSPSQPTVIRGSDPVQRGRCAGGRGAEDGE